MESTLVLFKEALFSAFHEWIKQNEKAIGDRWFNHLTVQEKKAWEDSNNAIHLIGTALWMFNMVSGFGVLAGLGPNNVQIHEIRDEIDEKTTKRLLLLISSTLSLQYLPKEISAMRIPEGKAPWRFSLYDYALRLRIHAQ
jgi:hypothetical protein